MKTIKFNINGMHCTSCAFNIDGGLEDTNGVKESSTSYAKQQTEVTFDPNKVPEEKLMTIIETLGYEATIYE